MNTTVMFVENAKVQITIDWTRGFPAGCGTSLGFEEWTEISTLKLP